MPFQIAYTKNTEPNGQPEPHNLGHLVPSPTYTAPKYFIGYSRRPGYLIVTLFQSEINAASETRSSHFEGEMRNLNQSGIVGQVTFYYTQPPTPLFKEAWLARSSPRGGALLFSSLAGAIRP